VVISIDGPAASGKSTMARALAHHLGYQHISSGNMYRLFALAGMRQKLDHGSPQAVERFLKHVKPGIDPDKERYLLEGEDVTDALGTPEVSDFTSRIATIAPIRDRINKILRQWCDGRDCVVEGRDIGTVVFPDARLKIYLTASLEERASRRFKELEKRGKGKASLQRVQQDLADRDRRDGSRDVAPLRAATDAHHIDSTGKPVEEVVRIIAALLRPRSPDSDPGRSDAKTVTY